MGASWLSNRGAALAAAATFERGGSRGAIDAN
jgi:hypothetical protein